MTISYLFGLIKIEGVGSMKHIKWKIVIIILVLICLAGTITGIIFFYYQDQQRKQVYQEAIEVVASFYDDAMQKHPKEDLTIEDLSASYEKINLVDDDHNREALLQKVDDLEQYLMVKNQLQSLFIEDILKPEVGEEDINAIIVQFNQLLPKYRVLLQEQLIQAQGQFASLKEALTAVRALFADDSLSTVLASVSREQYNDALTKVNALKQQDIKQQQLAHLKQVDDLLLAKEEEERRRQAELARIKREQEIKAAWVILDVPYISQNKNNVMNGCEVASLLMGLQYKGYLKDMDLVTYATNVPKSTDPFQGFTHDIFGIEPVSVPHWIAPSPLAKYGRDTSGAVVEDATGASLQDLDNEVVNGNPVVIYLTSKLKEPKSWVEGAPKNVHVLLLTGYNKITGEHIITDPWTHDDGRTKWQVSKATVEKLFNQTGKRAVVIK